jgi:serine/threonine protein kinase
MEERIKCPYCSEEILSTAKKCCYCSEWLKNSHQPTQKITSPPVAISDAATLIKQALAGKYQIINEIGKSGMATVYKAIQKSLNRTVALKVIHLNLIHEEKFLRRLKSGYIS